MAQFRYVYTNFWEDPKVSECFTPEDKLFFLYLLTNSHTTQIGVYRITKKLIAFEMGYSIETVNSLMVRFEDHHKLIKYNPETRELAIKNWGKFNLNKGGKPIEDLIRSEFKKLEDKELLLYVLQSINNEKIKQLYISELVKYGLINDEANNNGIVNDTSSDTFCGTSTTRGQNENENENENENNNIYSQHECDSKPVDNVDKPNLSDIKSDERESVPYDEIVKTYHNICTSMPRVTKITPKRKKLMKAIWNKCKDLNVYISLFTRAEKSEFLSGSDGKWTGCNFDWLLNSQNMLKVMEGNYDNRQGVQKPNIQAGGKVSTFNNFKQRDYDYVDLKKKLLGWK